jgi:hypothetical protein
MEHVGEEEVLVHRLEVVVDFEPSLFCDIPDPDGPRGTRRIVFAYFDGELTQERLEAALDGYRRTGFDKVEPGPDMPTPIGFFVKFTWRGKPYYAGAFTGYDLTSENIVMFVPARVLFGSL